jgi:ribosomal protein S18 acetylase RimI-like enzyme
VSKPLRAVEPVAFREAKSGDVPDLMRMMRKLAVQEPAIPFDEREIAATWTLFFSKPEFGRAWLVYAGGELAGYIILALGFSFEYRGHDAFIDELYIDEKYRHQGLGRQTMEFVEQRARELGVTAIHLEVDRENGPAQGLYRRTGYVDHDRYLMTKWLR